MMRGLGWLISEPRSCWQWKPIKFESGVRQLLSELGSSHTAFYHEHGKQVLPQHSINATLRGFSSGRI